MPSLAQSINEYLEAFRQRADQQTQLTMEQATQDLIDRGIEKNTLRRGERMPAFELPNQQQQLRQSTQLLQKPLIISFYRGGWCPFCNLELAAQQARLDDIRAAGAELVAISPEQPELAALMESKHHLDFDILYDKNNDLARKFGLVFTLPASIRSIYKTFGIDLVKHNGNENYELPIPATYIVDVNGTIQFDFVYADYRKRLEPEILLSQLEKIRSNSAASEPA